VIPHTPSQLDFAALRCPSLLVRLYPMALGGNLGGKPASDATAEAIMMTPPLSSALGGRR
jgi:hypothetical protein